VHHRSSSATNVGSDIAAAKARGVCKGRKPVIDAALVRKLMAEGVGATKIARRLDIGRASVYRLTAERAAA
jgi:DNA invertase Pin-like site-specific DNA recombinase